MSLETNHINWRHNPYTSKVTWEHYTEHDHTFFEIILIVKGSALHTVNGITETVSRGDMLLLRPSDKHYFKLLETDYAHRDVYITCGDMLSLCNFEEKNVYETIKNSPSPLSCKLDDLSIEYIDNYCEHFENFNAFNNNVMHNAIFLSFAQHLVGIFIDHNLQTNRTPEWLTEFLKTVTPERVMETSLDDFIAQTGYSHTHFCRLFKQYIGQTFTSYLSGIKLDSSLQLLSDEKLSVLEVSSMLGYDSLSHFITSFKDRFGLTPHKYRKNRL